MSSLINLGFACPPAFASPKHFDVNNFWNQQKRIRIGFLNDGLEAIHLPKAFGEPTKFRFLQNILVPTKLGGPSTSPYKVL